MVVSRAFLPDYPRWWRDSGLISNDLPPVQILDPHPSVPERTTVAYRVLDAAFAAVGGQGLYIPGLIFA